MNLLLTTAIQTAFTKPKYTLIETIEKEFAEYLKKRNPSFFSYPRHTDLKKLFSLYDEHYFSGAINEHILVSLKYSRKLTSSAGMILFTKGICSSVSAPKKEYIAKATISFSHPLIFDEYQTETDNYLVNGVVCRNPAEALMRVMEHELTHLVEYVLYNKSSCGQPQFQKICYDLFGHTESKHSIGVPLPTDAEKAKFKRGDKVSFQYENKVFKGTIERIQKRATVRIDNPQGNSPKRFYVPISLLTKVSDISP